jgi:YVTN family beta-propeller protein
VGANPDAVAVSPDGQHLYVVNAASDAVAVINTATKHVTTSVSVAGGPSGIAVSPNGQHLYVARPGSDAASVIDTATNHVTATIPVGDHPYYLAVSPDGTHVYVANGDAGTVSMTDAATNTVTATIPAGEYLTAIAVSRDGTTLYVTNNAAATVTVIAVAPAPIAPPGWSETLVAQILVGVINDAGGWIALDGKIIRVPPRQPVEVILAALPAQLARRLVPLLAVPPRATNPRRPCASICRKRSPNIRRSCGADSDL